MGQVSLDPHHDSLLLRRRLEVINRSFMHTWWDIPKLERKKSLENLYLFLDVCILDNNSSSLFISYSGLIASHPLQISCDDQVLI